MIKRKKYLSSLLLIISFFVFISCNSKKNETILHKYPAYNFSVSLSGQVNWKSELEDIAYFKILEDGVDNSSKNLPTFTIFPNKNSFMPSTIESLKEELPFTVSGVGGKDLSPIQETNFPAGKGLMATYLMKDGTKVLHVNILAGQWDYLIEYYAPEKNFDKYLPVVNEAINSIKVI